MERKSIHQDVIIGIIILIACAFFFIYNRELNANAGMMPRLLLGVLTLLGAFVLVDGIKKTRRGNEEEMKKFITFSSLKIPFTTYIFIFAYVVLFKVVGYFVATPLFLISLMLYFKEKSLKIIIIVTVVYLAIIYLIFVKQLNVSVDNFGWIGTWLSMR